jgi:imidazolonepropionase-like amidohydrolase
VGQRADLLLVDGDPTTTIGDTLNIREVWRRGIRQSAA